MNKRGGQPENKNAAKEGLHRVPVTLSLRERRLAWMIARLHQEGKEVNIKNLRQLAYKAIDVYIGLQEDRK